VIFVQFVNSYLLIVFVFSEKEFVYFVSTGPEFSYLLRGVRDAC
jgi:hypothetical protein